MALFETTILFTQQIVSNLLTALLAIIYLHPHGTKIHIHMFDFHLFTCRLYKIIILNQMYLTTFWIYVRMFKFVCVRILLLHASLIRVSELYFGSAWLLLEKTATLFPEQLLCKYLFYVCMLYHIDVESNTKRPFCCFSICIAYPWTWWWKKERGMGEGKGIFLLDWRERSRYRRLQSCLNRMQIDIRLPTNCSQENQVSWKGYFG